MRNFEVAGFSYSSDELRAIDSCTLWHPFTQMLSWSGENAPIIHRAEGVRLFDLEGRPYLDGVSSLWCNVHGHAHPALDGAIRDQIGRVAHSTLLGLGSTPSIMLADQLAARTGIEHVFFSDSGSAAVEVALKIAFQYWSRVEGEGERTKFVSFRNAYHGDTLGSVSVGGIELFHSLFRPLIFESLFAPSPFPYRHPAPDRAMPDALAELERILDENVGEVAAVVMEPLVQGAAGMIVHPPGFLAAVRRITAERNVLLIADEVATGFGRTGRMFAIEHENVLPDLLVLGKGITGGYLPLSATLATGRIFSAFLGRHEEFRHFLHGHTYTGNALASAVALASLRVFDEERTIASLPAKERILEESLRPLEDSPIVGEIRRRGMMVGIELVRDKATKEPFPPALRTGHRVILEARRRGLVIRPLGDVVVLMPPLSATAEDLAEICSIARASIEAQEQ